MIKKVTSLEKNSLLLYVLQPCRQARKYYVAGLCRHRLNKGSELWEVNRGFGFCAEPAMKVAGYYWFLITKVKAVALVLTFLA